MPPDPALGTAAGTSWTDAAGIVLVALVLVREMFHYLRSRDKATQGPSHQDLMERVAGLEGRVTMNTDLLRHAETEMREMHMRLDRLLERR